MIKSLTLIIMDKIVRNNLVVKDNTSSDLKPANMYSESGGVCYKLKKINKYWLEVNSYLLPINIDLFKTVTSL